MVTCQEHVLVSMRRKFSSVAERCSMILLSNGKHRTCAPAIQKRPNHSWLIFSSFHTISLPMPKLVARLFHWPLRRNHVRSTNPCWVRSVVPLQHQAGDAGAQPVAAQRSRNCGTRRLSSHRMLVTTGVAALTEVRDTLLYRLSKNVDIPDVIRPKPGALSQ